MFEYHKLYLTKSKKYIDLEIFIPKSKNKLKTMYFFDGQNTFLDSHATFGRSLRAHKILKKNDTLGVAICGANSNEGRMKEYAPFKMKDYEISCEYCYAFIDDLIDTIIPFIEERYNVIKDSNSRIIYGSSLAALTSIYAGLKYDSFKYVLAFSTASFLCEDELFNFILKFKNKAHIFLYVGLNEASDNLCNKNDYINSSTNLYNLLKDNNYICELKIDKKGIHNEKSWGKHLKDFFKFMKKYN